MRIALFYLFLGITVPAEAGGMRLEEDGLVNVESPATVGQWKARFDFQHTWTRGDLLPNQRVPIAELTLRGGVMPGTDLRATSLFNNSDVELGAQRAYKRFALQEFELQQRLLDQSAGKFLSLAVAADWAKWNLKSAVNATVVTFDGKVYGGKLLAHRDFARWGTYAALKWVHTEFVQTSQTYVVTALGLGARVKLVRTKKAQIDAIAEWSPILNHDKDFGEAPKNVWSGGAQFKMYNPHTITLFATNATSSTLADSVFGHRETIFGFRWSYRF